MLKPLTFALFFMTAGGTFVVQAQTTGPATPDAASRPKDQRLLNEDVTAQVGWTVHESRSDFTRADGSRVRAPMIFQPCFLAVETNERMVAKSVAPSAERKPPEIFWRSFIMRPSRSA